MVVGLNVQCIGSRAGPEEAAGSDEFARRQKFAPVRKKCGEHCGTVFHRRAMVTTLLVIDVEHRENDEQLFRDGDPSAFQRIRDEYIRRILRVLLASSADSHLVDDALQIGFLNAWEKRDTFHGGNLGGWLTALCRNALIDLQRSQTRRRAMPLIDDLDHAAEPDRTQERDRQLRVLEECLKELDSSFIRTLRMQIVAEMSTEQSAEVAGITPNNVYKHVYRAKQELKTLYRGEATVTIHLLDMPEQINDWPTWLEQHMIDLTVGELAEELMLDRQLNESQVEQLPLDDVIDSESF